MRRTTICFAIFALLLSASALAQEPVLGTPMPPTPSPDAADAGSANPAATTASPAAVPYTGQAGQKEWGPMEEVSPGPDVTTSSAVPSTGMMAVPRHPDEYPRGPCCEKTGKGYWCPPIWYLEQRVRIMYHPKTRPIITAQFGIIGVGYDPISQGYVDTFYRTGGMGISTQGFEPGAGYETTLGHYLGRDSDNRDQFLEFTYYGLNQWNADYAIHQSNLPTISGADPDVWPNQGQLDDNQSVVCGNLYSIFDVGLAGFNRADDIEEHYSSRFDNFELNFRIRPRPMYDRLVLYKNGRWRREAQYGCICSFLVGFRGVSLDENYRLSGEGSIATTNTTTGVTTTGDTAGNFTVRSHNDLVGIQIGGDMVWRKGFLELGTRVKAGAFVNFADQFSNLISTGGLEDPLSTQALYAGDDEYTEDRAAKSRDVAGIGEFGFTAGYEIRKNLMFRASYDIMFMSGLALAPEQIDGQIGAPSRINHNGLLMFQSLSLGLELEW